MFSILQKARSMRAGVEDLLRRVGVLDEADGPAVAPQTVHPGEWGRAAVLVIDQSGSMAESDWLPSRLMAAQEAAKAFVDRLAREEPTAEVAVIGYSCSATVAIRFTPVTAAPKIRRAIDGLSPLASTDLHAGLSKALRLLQQASNPTKQVITLSDGHANPGRGGERVAARIRALAVHETIGIGGTPADVDERLLKTLASDAPNGGKRYRFIGDREQLIQQFQTLAGRITRH